MWGIGIHTTNVIQETSKDQMMRSNWLSEVKLFSLAILWMKRFSSRVHDRPDGAAIAERLWSQGELKIDEFIPRLNELRCRMLESYKIMGKGSSWITSKVLY
uniref:Uncharacterized protein n=1 Tax=Trichobilharzia regenti TaxID=157069 RepID=A0AA85J7M8_TRIRE|nr:unnamed protein product [Trichobilharzia regenti]